jgi:DNA helicase-2/ATP-dependent DNA helicase PcrA
MDIFKNKRQIFIGDFCSGKTKRLVDIYVDLIKNQQINPSNILFLSMDNKNFYSKVLPHILENTKFGFEDLWIDNYFSFCRKILRKHYRLLNLPKNFEVISGFEQKILLKKIVANKNFFGRDVACYVSTSFVNDLVNVIDLIKLNYSDFVNTKLTEDSPFFLKQQELLKFFNSYQDTLEKYDFLDYRDLIIKTTQLFKQNSEILDQYLSKFECIFLDDLEEISGLEFELLMLFCNTKNIDTKVFAGANENGAVNGFRGADPERYLKRLVEVGEFEKVNVGGERTLPSPLFGKEREQEKRERGQEGRVGRFENEEDEIYWIGRKIRELIINENYEPKDIAVVRRKLKDSSKIYRRVFTELKIPFYLSGMGGVFDNPVVVNVMQYLKTLDKFERKESANILEFDAYFENLIKVFCIGIKNKSEIYEDFWTIKKDLIENNKIKSLFDDFRFIAQNEDIDNFADNTKKAIKDFFEIFEYYQNNKNCAVKSLILKIFEKYFNNIQEIYENLKIFLEKIADFEVIFKKIYEKEFDLESFIDFLDEILEAYTFETAVKDDNENVVQIVTIQKMKGIRKKIIFFAGCSDGIIPQVLKESKFFSRDELEIFGLKKKLEYSDFLKEEKILFDLAVSRAEQEIFISYSENLQNAGRNKDLKLSFFVDEFFENKTDSLKKYDYKKKYESDFDPSKIQTSQELNFFNSFNFFNFSVEKQCLASNAPTFLTTTKSLSKKYLTHILSDFKYSASSLKNYKECNFLFLLSRLLKLEIARDKVAFEFGNIVHEILWRFHEKYNHYADISSPNAVSDMQKLVDKSFELKKYVFECLGEMIWYKNKALKILVEYLDDLRLQKEPWKIFELEKKFESEINNTKLVGRIDRIDEIGNGYFEVLDYKTGKHENTGRAKTGKSSLLQAIEDGEEFQFLVYQLLVRDVLGAEKVKKFSYIWLEKNTRGGKKYGFDVDDSGVDEVLKIGEKKLMELISKIKKDDFSKVEKTKKCTDCMFNFVCGE